MKLNKPLIRKLALKAGADMDYACADEPQPMLYGKDIEKFTRLILAECQKAIKNENLHQSTQFVFGNIDVQTWNNVDTGMEMCKLAIKNHFQDINQKFGFKSGTIIFKAKA